MGRWNRMNARVITKFDPLSRTTLLTWSTIYILATVINKPLPRVLQQKSNNHTEFNSYMEVLSCYCTSPSPSLSSRNLYIVTKALATTPQCCNDGRWMWVISIVARVWTMYFLSVSIRTLDCRFLSVPARNFGIGNGLGSCVAWMLNKKTMNTQLYYRVYTLILTGVDLRGSVPPLVATLAVVYIHVYTWLKFTLILGLDTYNWWGWALW